ncbi:hypothetical protein KDA_39880 [Dictyobacter alpinus]|uniref:Uncharacterized protein n=1 Tax=Dictyobacter alpinus TaxID=2014873 RepID=A0A402BAY6_9CHLR|nr:hypothetical protein KDA_39880 [Dictyobacter alpinus]
MSLNANLAGGGHTYLFGRNHQALHAFGGMHKKLFKSRPVGVYPYVRGMFEYFIRLSHLTMLNGHYTIAAMYCVDLQILHVQTRFYLLA